MEEGGRGGGGGAAGYLKIPLGNVVSILAIKTPSNYLLSLPNLFGITFPFSRVSYYFFLFVFFYENSVYVKIN